MLIGSQAMRHHIPSFPRDPQDIDYIYENGIVKVENINHNCQGIRRIFEIYDTDIAPPDLLYTLKVSHAFFSNIWFKKTIYDIKWYQSSGHVKTYGNVNEELFKLLYKDWEKMYGTKKANLNMKNEDFFTKHVNRVYEHDFIHDCVKFYDTPMYNKIKIDKNLAKVEKNLFDKLDFYDKIKTCLEEIYVIALERFLIPKDFNLHYKVAIHGAIKLLVTKMTKGWFPKFIIMNISEIDKQVNNTFIKKFKTNANYE